MRAGAELLTELAQVSQLPSWALALRQPGWPKFGVLRAEVRDKMVYGEMDRPRYSTLGWYWKEVGLVQVYLVSESPLWFWSV
jgi:hypothetical protein